MRQINWKEMTVEEIGALVCSHLEKHQYKSGTSDTYLPHEENKSRGS